MEFLLTISMLFTISTSFPMRNESKGMVALDKRDHLKESLGHHSKEPAVLSDLPAEALAESQRSFGVNQTGIVDSAAQTAVKTSWFGFKNERNHSALKRKKRYVLEGSHWSKSTVTYRISKYSKRLPNHVGTEQVLARAFKVWSDVSSLTFREKRRGRVDIDIRFEEGDHGCSESLDGPKGKLAHAFYPQFGGNVHFDDAEDWIIDRTEGTSLFHVATHEFGHALGIAHSENENAVMFEKYDSSSVGTKLDTDDINAIQILYGTREDPLVDEFGSPTDNSDAQDMCSDAKIDAATRTHDGNTYFFRGDFYWRIERGTAPTGFPKRITDDWGGLEGNLDAALTWRSGKTYFFKGDKYWRFTNMNMDLGYPRDISEGFEGIPEASDAAFVWSGNGNTYFFKGDQYWMFDSSKTPPVSDKFPKRIRNWRGLPNDIDAAFQWENQHTYFFKGKEFYRFDDDNFRVDSADPPYPRLTSAWWFHCRPVS